MGWTSVHMSKGENKKDFIEHQLFGYVDSKRFSILQHSMKGNVSYMAVRNNESEEVFAMVTLISIDNSSYNNFSYKEMDETCGPCYYDASASLLNKLTPTTSEYALKWREECWNVINGKKTTPKVEDGTTIRFIKPLKFNNGEVLDTFTVRKYGKKTRFKSGYGLYDISKWREREFEVIG